MHYTTIAQITRGKNECSTVYSAAFNRALTTAVQSVVEPCNIAVYYTPHEISSAIIAFGSANYTAILHGSTTDFTAVVGAW